MEEQYKISISKKTIKRILRIDFSWRRIHKKVKGEPDELEYKIKKQALEELKRQDKKGIIDLRYFDESGFCLEPYVPYAWQEKDNPIEIETCNSRRINVLGIMNVNNDLTAYTVEDVVNSDLVIACINDFCKDLKKETVIVIDNASPHTSKSFKKNIPKWKEKGLEIFYLPPYSPKLNLIEILWKFMKYEWINFSAYKSWKHLVDYIDDVLNNFGQEYIINYG
ncbi:MAG: IS630 family transposase [Nitrospirae bacterium]|nr:IS630 family transposase [Nitrospirota bacterium]